MDWELISKVVTAAVAVLGGGRIIHEMAGASRRKLREEYIFASQFLTDLREDNEMHPFVKEKGYQALAGTVKIQSSEVAYILTLENSPRFLREYVFTMKYLEHLPTNGNLSINFAEKYKKKWARLWRKCVYLAVYFLLAMASFSPFILGPRFGIAIDQILMLSLFTIPVFWYFAIAAIRASFKISQSEKLVERQKQHTQRILVRP